MSRSTTPSSASVNVILWPPSFVKKQDVETFLSRSLVYSLSERTAVRPAHAKEEDYRQPLVPNRRQFVSDKDPVPEGIGA
jgi:hypothetical protein